MELDDLKNAWEAIGQQAEKKHRLNTEVIDNITKKKYYSKLKKITYPEIAGAVTCFLGAGFIVLNFNKLSTFYLQAVGIAAILLLLLLPVASLLSLRRFNMVDNLKSTYADTLRQFAFEKIRFQKIQKASALFCYLLLVAVIILFPPLFDGKDIGNSRYFWIFSFPVGYLFLLFFSGWISKRYSNAINQAEELLKELDS